MKENISLEQIEKMIENLEKQELLKAPPNFEQQVMAKIAERSREKEKVSRFSEGTRRFFYQVKIAGAMAASLLLLVPSGQQILGDSLENTRNISIEQNVLTDKMRQGTNRISNNLNKVSGYMMERITEVVSYEK